MRADHVVPRPRQALLGYGVGICACKQSSPSDAQLRSLLVREMMGSFRPMVGERRLTALIYYSWTGDPPFEVYPSGALTESGRWRLRLLWWKIGSPDLSGNSDVFKLTSNGLPDKQLLRQTRKTQ
jgi:hypothetical protein